MSVSSEAQCLESAQCADIAIKVAMTREERLGAFRLAYSSYLRAGLCKECREAVRITPYQLLPTTDIIVAELRGEIISTLSLVRDGELGLPLEAIYPEEVKHRRDAGKRLAEVSCLADRRRDVVRFFPLFCELARVMMQMGEREGVDQLLIAVHPRHARMYRRAMGFKQVGDDRDYPAVNGNPAVMLSLDFAEAKVEIPLVWRAIVGDPLAAEVVATRPMGDVEREYFTRLAESIASQDDAGRAEAQQIGAPAMADHTLICA